MAGRVWNISRALVLKLPLNPEDGEKQHIRRSSPLQASLEEVEFPGEHGHPADSLRLPSEVPGFRLQVTGNLSASTWLFIEGFIGFFHNSKKENQTNVTSYYPVH